MFLPCFLVFCLFCSDDEADQEKEVEMETYECMRELVEKAKPNKFRLKIGDSSMNPKKILLLVEMIKKSGVKYW